MKTNRAACKPMDPVDSFPMIRFWYTHGGVETNESFPTPHYPRHSFHHEKNEWKRMPRITLAGPLDGRKSDGVAGMDEKFSFFRAVGGVRAAAGADRLLRDRRENRTLAADLAARLPIVSPSTLIRREFREARKSGDPLCPVTVYSERLSECDARTACAWGYNESDQVLGRC